VAVAFADSSIVVLALPQLYTAFDTSVVGVSFVITAYNLVVAAVGLTLVPLSRRIRPAALAIPGLALFLGASIGCSASDSLALLITFRSLQGVGAAALLAASLPLLAALSVSEERGIAIWTTAGTLGAAFGPALGGALTEAFDWRAIFVAQAPVAGLAILAAFDRRVRALPAGAGFARPRGLLAANLGLVFVFAALVGALFLAVLLMVTVWELSPIAGAGVVTCLPAAALLARPLGSRLPRRLDVVGGAVLLALGLVCLALLPAASPAYAGAALALCGVGLGLALPPLTGASVARGPALGWSSTLSITARHAGLVLALVLVAPLLGHELEQGGERATLNATAVVLDAPIPLTKKVPIALDLRDAFETTPNGEVPDLATPFDRHGAGSDEAVRAVRDDLLETIRAALTRSFRTSFALAALLGLLAVIPALLRRRVGA
jgi:predicted MFS family arabinose efflux permease